MPTSLLTVPGLAPALLSVGGTNVPANPDYQARAAARRSQRRRESGLRPFGNPHALVRSRGRVKQYSRVDDAIRQLTSVV